MAQDNETLLSIVGRNIDRVTTVEMRISDYSRGVIANLHAAAVSAQGGGPLSMLGARKMIDNIKPGRSVILTTGAGDPRFLPAGETDGPPGLVVLARAVAALGGVPILLTEAPFIDNVRATAIAIGLGVRDADMAPSVPWSCAILPVSADNDASRQAEDYLTRFDPTLLVSIEKLGPNPEGIAHTASGKPTADGRGRAEHLFDLAASRGLPTLGIGDNGNEIGFGLILDAVRKFKPAGDRLGTRVATDVLVPANTSNWGGYGVVAAMAAILERPDLLHTPEDEERLIRACVDANGVDGSTGRHILQVDGMSMAVNCGLVAMLNGIVRASLVKGFKRPF
ncbi:MAG: hypothetical protein BGP06_09280 [Rhizobiales bacterium 65-9]|nr:DUF4392 domain-containing protein [Hyphomicrobiales bacterium]OJY38652.1 MAG: hypothetical protein BGP06_09280 [Rhizobiales bacterium 65-9]